MNNFKEETSSTQNRFKRILTPQELVADQQQVQSVDILDANSAKYLRGGAGCGHPDSDSQQRSSLQDSVSLSLLAAKQLKNSNNLQMDGNESTHTGSAAHNQNVTNNPQSGNRFYHINKEQNQREQFDSSTGRTQVSMMTAHYREANIQSRQSSIHLPQAAPLPINAQILPISNDTQHSTLKTLENENEYETNPLEDLKVQNGAKIIIPYKKESSTVSSAGQTKFVPHDYNTTMQQYPLLLPDTQESDRDQSNSRNEMSRIAEVNTSSSFHHQDQQKVQSALANSSLLRNQNGIGEQSFVSDHQRETGSQIQNQNEARKYEIKTEFEQEGNRLSLGTTTDQLNQRTSVNRTFEQDSKQLQSPTFAASQTLLGNNTMNFKRQSSSSHDFQATFVPQTTTNFTQRLPLAPIYQNMQISEKGRDNYQSTEKSQNDRMYKNGAQYQSYRPQDKTHADFRDKLSNLKEALSSIKSNLTSFRTTGGAQSQKQLGGKSQQTRNQAANAIQEKPEPSQTYTRSDKNLQQAFYGSHKLSQNYYTTPRNEDLKRKEDRQAQIGNSSQERRELISVMNLENETFQSQRRALNTFDERAAGTRNRLTVEDQQTPITTPSNLQQQVVSSSNSRAHSDHSRRKIHGQYTTSTVVVDPETCKSLQPSRVSLRGAPSAADLKTSERMSAKNLRNQKSHKSIHTVKRGECEQEFLRKAGGNQPQHELIERKSMQSGTAAQRSYGSLSKATAKIMENFNGLNENLMGISDKSLSAKESLRDQQKSNRQNSIENTQRNERNEQIQTNRSPDNNNILLASDRSPSLKIISGTNLRSLEVEHRSDYERKAISYVPSEQKYTPNHSQLLINQPTSLTNSRSYGEVPQSQTMMQDQFQRKKEEQERMQRIAVRGQKLEEFEQKRLSNNYHNDKKTLTSIDRSAREYSDPSSRLVAQNHTVSNQFAQRRQSQPNEDDKRSEELKYYHTVRDSMQGRDIILGGSQDDNRQESSYSPHQRRNMVIHDGAQKDLNGNSNNNRFTRVQTPFEDPEQMQYNNRCEISISDQQHLSIEVEPISNQITLTNGGGRPTDHINPISFAPSDIEEAASDPLKLQIQSEMDFSRNPNMMDKSSKPQTVQNQKQDHKRASRYDIRVQTNDRSFKYARSSSNPVLVPYPGRTPPNNEQHSLSKTNQIPKNSSNLYRTSLPPPNNRLQSSSKGAGEPGKIQHLSSQPTLGHQTRRDHQNQLQQQPLAISSHNRHNQQQELISPQNETGRIPGRIMSNGRRSGVNSRENSNKRSSIQASETVQQTEALLDKERVQLLKRQLEAMASENQRLRQLEAGYIEDRNEMAKELQACEVAKKMAENKICESEQQKLEVTNKFELAAKEKQFLIEKIVTLTSAGERKQNTIQQMEENRKQMENSLKNGKVFQLAKENKVLKEKLRLATELLKEGELKNLTQRTKVDQVYPFSLESALLIQAFIAELNSECAPGKQPLTVDQIIRRLKKEHKLCGKLARLVGEVEGKPAESLNAVLKWIKGLLSDFVNLKEETKQKDDLICELQNSIDLIRQQMEQNLLQVIQSAANQEQPINQSQFGSNEQELTQQAERTDLQNQFLQTYKQQNVQQRPTSIEFNIESVQKLNSDEAQAQNSTIQKINNLSSIDMSILKHLSQFVQIKDKNNLTSQIRYQNQNNQAQGIQVADHKVPQQCFQDTEQANLSEASHNLIANQMSPNVFMGYQTPQMQIQEQRQENQMENVDSTDPMQMQDKATLKKEYAENCQQQFVLQPEVSTLNETSSALVQNNQSSRQPGTHQNQRDQKSAQNLNNQNHDQLPLVNIRNEKILLSDGADNSHRVYFSQNGDTSQGNVSHNPYRDLQLNHQIHSNEQFSQRPDAISYRNNKEVTGGGQATASYNQSLVGSLEQQSQSQNQQMATFQPPDIVQQPITSSTSQAPPEAFFVEVPKRRQKRRESGSRKRGSQNNRKKKTKRSNSSSTRYAVMSHAMVNSAGQSQNGAILSQTDQLSMMQTGSGLVSQKAAQQNRIQQHPYEERREFAEQLNHAQHPNPQQNVVGKENQLNLMSTTQQHIMNSSSSFGAIGQPNNSRAIRQRSSGHQTQKNLTQNFDQLYYSTNQISSTSNQNHTQFNRQNRHAEKAVELSHPLLKGYKSTPCTSGEAGITTGVVSNVASGMQTNQTNSVEQLQAISAATSSVRQKIYQKGKIGLQRMKKSQQMEVLLNTKTNNDEQSSSICHTNPY